VATLISAAMTQSHNSSSRNLLMKTLVDKFHVLRKTKPLSKWDGVIAVLEAVYCTA